MRAAHRIETTPAGDADREYWAAGQARPYAVPRRERKERFPVEVPGRPAGPAGPGPDGPRLTAREAAAVLGVSQQELTDLVTSGVLSPVGPDQPGARRFPASEVEAVLNGAAEPAEVVPISRQATVSPPSPVVPRPGRPSGPTGLTGTAGARAAGLVAQRPPERRPVPPPPRLRRGAGRPAGDVPAGLTAAKADPAHRAQARYLRALARAIVAAVGPDADCELRWQEKHPFLPYLRVRETPIWSVSTSTGWRFLWNRYRSHPATDAAGAAQMIVADLSLRDGPGGSGGSGGPGGSGPAGAPE